MSKTGQKIIAGLKEAIAHPETMTVRQVVKDANGKERLSPDAKPFDEVYPDVAARLRKRAERGEPD